MFILRRRLKNEAVSELKTQDEKQENLSAHLHELILVPWLGEVLIIDEQMLQLGPHCYLLLRFIQPPHGDPCAAIHPASLRQ